MKKLVMLFAVMLVGCNGLPVLDQPFEAEQSCTWDGATFGIIRFERAREGNCEKVRAVLEGARKVFIKRQLSVSEAEFNTLFAGVDIWVHEKDNLDEQPNVGNVDDVTGVYRVGRKTIELNWGLRSLGHEMLHHYEWAVLHYGREAMVHHDSWKSEKLGENFKMVVALVFVETLYQFGNGPVAEKGN